MTNLQVLHKLSADDIAAILAPIVDKSELSDRLCERCMKRHGGNCINPVDCEAGDYSAEELVKMYLGWEIQA